MSNFTTTGIVSSTPSHPSIGWNNSWIVIDNNANRELYAQAMYVTNFDELEITLSAGDLRIGSIEINDPRNINSKATIDAPTSSLNVKINNSDYATSNNQEIEITLLNQLTANTNTSIALLNTLTADDAITNTLLKTLTSLQETKQSEIITLLNQLTANTDGLELNLDNLELNTDSLETILSVLTSNDVVFTTLFKTLTSDNTIFTTAFKSLTSNLNTTVTLLRTLTTDDVTITTLLKTLTSEQISVTSLLNALTSNNIETLSVLNSTLSTLVGLTSIEITNPVTAVDATIINPVTAVQLLNPVTAVEILNPVTAIEVLVEQLTVTNPVTAVMILNPVTAFDVAFEDITVSNPVTAVHISNTQISPVPIAITDRGSLDAFSRLRVSTPTTLFDSKTLHNKSSLFWSQVSSGSGSFIGFTGEGTDASVTLSTINTGEYAIRQTTQRFNYQPGKSQLALFTGILTPEDHSIKRYGLFQSLTATPYNPTVGLYFETQTDSPTSIAVVQSNQGYLVPSLSATRNNWNIDKLDGTGISGKVLSLSAANIFLIDFEWLGVGRVRYGAVIDGQICYCHQFNNAGNVQGAYIRTPNLPIRAEIRQIAQGASTLKMICCSVMSEGGEDFTGVTRAVDSGTIGLTIAAGTRKAILGVRLQLNKLDSVNEILNISGLVLASNNGNAASACFKYELLHNPTLSNNGTWSDISTNSNFEAWRGNSDIIADGTVITSGFSGAGGTIDLSGYRFEKFLRMGCTIDGRRDELYLVMTPLQPNEGVFGSMTFIESD